MPPESLPLVVTSGLGIGVFAGVVSGICYVVFQGFKTNGNRNRKFGVNTISQCCVCGIHFNIKLNKDNKEQTKDLLSSVRRRVRCQECNGWACRAACSLYLRREGVWLCTQCRKPSSWFRALLTSWTPETGRMSTQDATTNTLQSLPAIKDNVEGEKKEVVRDFIERLVGSMLEANLDDTSVNRLYRDPEYDAIFHRYHSNLSSALTDLGSALHLSFTNLPIVNNQSPCTAHSTLKSIIRRVIRDASNMAILTQPHEQEAEDEAVNKTYEDLLATAILNKVIDNYQKDVTRSSSASSSYSKKSDRAIKQKKVSKPAAVDVNNDDNIWKSQDMDTTSVSSVDDWCRSESSFGSKHIDPVSLTIQHRIEEISTSEDEILNSQYIPSNNLSRNSFRNDHNDRIDREEWQDNWLFSRKGKGSPKPVPVPMLVPNPSTEFRALIGDRDADDTTDLSETGSDIDETETIPSLKNILVDSRTIIGGKNILLENINKVESDNLEESNLEPEFEIIEDTEMNDESECFDRIDTPISVHVHAEVIINGKAFEMEEMVNGNEKEENDVDKKLYKETNHVQDKKIKNKEEIGNNEIILDTCSVYENVDKNEGTVTVDNNEAKNVIVINSTPYEESDSFESNTEKDAEYTEKYASFPRPIRRKSPVPNPRNMIANTEDSDKSNSVLINGNQINEEIDKNTPGDDSSLQTPIEGSYSKREKEKWLNPIPLENNPYSKENLDKRLKKNTTSDINGFGRDYYVRDSKRSTGGKDKIEEETAEKSKNDLARPKSLNLEQNGYNEKYIADPSIFTAIPAVIDPEEESKSLENRPVSMLSSDSDDMECKRVYNVETGKIIKYNIKDEILKGSKSPEGFKSFIEDMISPNTFDENHNHPSDLTKKQEPIMKISSCNELQSIGVKNVPLYEEKVCSIDLSSETSDGTLTSIEKPSTPCSFTTDKSDETLVSYSNDEEEITPPPMRDISKKYLNSLVRSTSKPYNLDEVSTPLISIQEIPKSPKKENNTLDLSQKSKSMADIRSDDDSQNFLSLEYPVLKERKIVRQFIEDFTKSVPNITECDDSEFISSSINNRTKSLSSKTVIEDEVLLSGPKVKDLMKLFDKKEEKTKINHINTSQLTVPKVKNHVHSLTARHLPTPVRQKLEEEQKNVNGFGSEEVIDDEILKQIPTCRSKIEFFECLKNK